MTINNGLYDDLAGGFLPAQKPNSNLNGFSFLLTAEGAFTYATKVWSDIEIGVSTKLRPDGGVVGNYRGLHDLIYRDEEISPSYDYLNGAKMVVEETPDGIPVMRYDDPELPNPEAGWFAGGSTSTYGVRPDTDMFTADPVASPPVYSGSPFVPSPGMVTNMMIFGQFYIAQNEDIALAKLMGIDLDGYTIPGAVSVGIHPGATLTSGFRDGFGINDTAGPTGQAVALSDIITTNQYGIYTIAMTVNGTTTGAYWRKVADGVLSTGANNYSDALSAAWNGQTLNAGKLNLGAGCIRGSGVVMMGVRNYSAAIPSYELNRAAAFMHATNKLPYWWTEDQ